MATGSGTWTRVRRIGKWAAVPFGILLGVAAAGPGGVDAQAGPDLRPLSMTPTPSAGQSAENSVSVQYQVINSGTASSVSHQDQLLLSTDNIANPATDTSLDVASRGSTAAGVTYTGSMAGTIPVSFPVGSQFLCV